MLLAKIKANQKFYRYILFSGREYVKGEFRPVPRDMEEQARKDDRVDLKEVAKEDMEEIVPEAAPAPAKPASSSYHSKSKKNKEENPEDAED